MDDRPVPATSRISRGRVDAALRRRANWEQLVKFCVVGATGYVVNLAVYTALLRGADIHYVPAAIGSFLVAVSNNYWWNRHWTFRGQRGHVVFQGLRFFVVSAIALVANLVVLHVLVTLGLGEVVAQAIAIMLVTPVNFVGNKLWSFRHRR
jgi:dolichol-phosphate mannosyltransferase